MIYPVRESEALTINKRLPQFTLNPYDDGSAREYLGLKNNKPFFLSHIRAKLIIIEFFSLYCQACKENAPMVSRIYASIQQDPSLSKKVKLIGIGVGNNKEEVDIFRESLRVPFPLFTDPDFTVHRKLGEPRAPVTLLTTRNGNVLIVHYGVIDDVDSFLLRIKEAARQK
jgi:thiol-disulfide isomerase/thioredoxin